MSEDRFDTIKVGDSAEFSHVIRASDIDSFANLTGDDNPLHMDDGFAARAGFGKRVVHGMLAASFLSTMVGTRLPGEGSLWYEQTLRFLAPVRVGEKIRVTARVTGKSQAQRIVSLETVVFGEQGNKVIEGEAKVKVLEPEEIATSVAAEDEKGAVVVAGASRGIGAAIAAELAGNGFPIVIGCSNSPEQGEAVAASIRAAGGRAVVATADVRDPAAVSAMVDLAVSQYGKLAAAVHNASPPIRHKDFLEMAWDDVALHMDVSVRGAFNLAQAALPAMLEVGGGCIVNVASIFAEQAPPAKMAHYSLAKAALVSLTHSLAVEFGPAQVRVNCVSPGMTRTELIADVPDKAKMVAKMTTPLRRLAEPADIAGVVGFLVSEKARHITGENVRVCGGLVMS